MNILTIIIKHYGALLFGGSLMLVSMQSIAACSGPLSLPPNELEQTVIVLFGDSITTGFNSSFPVDLGNGTVIHGCPTISLRDLLDQEPKRSNRVVNWGDGGTSSTQGAGRILIELGKTTASHSAKDRIVLILYGTNDQSFGISTATTGFNIRLMIQRARSVGYDPVVGTLTPRTDRDVVPYNGQIIANANLEGAFIVDHFSRFVSDANWPNSLMDPVEPANQKLHPSDVGYQVIAQTWFDQRLEDIIEPDPLPAPVLGGMLYLLLGD